MLCIALVEDNGITYLRAGKGSKNRHSTTNMITMDVDSLYSYHVAETGCFARWKRFLKALICFMLERAKHLARLLVFIAHKLIHYAICFVFDPDFGLYLDPDNGRYNTSKPFCTAYSCNNVSQSLQNVNMSQRQRVLRI